MADNTKIEWADATLNYVNGCTRVSPGCVNCYAERLAATRLRGVPSRAGLAEMTTNGPRWTGLINIDDRALEQALRWRRPRRIFWNAHGDLFHESVPDAAIDRLFAVCALTPHHTHMILTKRAGRMREYVSRFDDAWHGNADLFNDRMMAAMDANHAWLNEEQGIDDINWPLPNVWLGVSVEDQQRADERIPDLLATPAAVRFISVEPLLGPVDLTRIHEVSEDGLTQSWESCLNGKRFSEWGGPDGNGGDVDGHARLDWVIAGGESGPGARPMHPDWARSLRDQCAAVGVPFLFKQWGEWAPQVGAVDGWAIPDNPEISRFDYRDWEGDHWGAVYSKGWQDDVDDNTVSRIGKKLAGRLLDGIEHNAFPEVRHD